MRFGKSVFVFALSTAVTACVTLDLGDIKDGILNGRVLVQWIKEDGFIYRKTNDPLSFQPSFMSSAIIPEDMYTDGGSVPRVFWSIPGLSPWGLGPAYIVHDWIFEVHRCGDRGTPEERAIHLRTVGTDFGRGWQIPDRRRSYRSRQTWRDRLGRADALRP